MLNNIFYPIHLKKKNVNSDKTDFGTNTSKKIDFHNDARDKIRLNQLLNYIQLHPQNEN